ncbi:hypothetical protein V6N12_002971 [Hibiscus sabdariffa]|uniref:Thioredoxin domain-containing protein n=1 Tax=Hibiscus sabdariffa TaxID=183260 RepID=A0ABR2EAZ4_9ROSI
MAMAFGNNEKRSVVGYTNNLRMKKARIKQSGYTIGDFSKSLSLGFLDFDVLAAFSVCLKILRSWFGKWVAVQECRSGCGFVNDDKSESDDADSDQAVEFVGGNVHRVTSKEVWDQKLSEAKRGGRIVIANFSAKWCGSCRMIAPFYCELSEKQPLMFLLIDIDEISDFSSSWDIRATPTFLFLKDGQQIGKLVGANKQELQKKIAGVLDSFGNYRKINLKKGPSGLARTPILIALASAKSTELVKHEKDDPPTRQPT